MFIGKCKLKIPGSRCRSCVQEQRDNDVIIDCNKMCTLKNKEYDILGLEYGLLGAKAIVFDGKETIEVLLSRLTDCEWY